MSAETSTEQRGLVRLVWPRLRGMALLYAGSGTVYGIAATLLVTALVPPAQILPALVLLGFGFLALSTVYIGVVTHRIRQAAQQDARILQASEARYRLIAENSTDVIWTFDNEGRVTYVSPSVQRCQGYTPEEAMATPVEDSVTDSSVGVLMDMRAQALAQMRGLAPDRPVLAEVRRRCKDGSAAWSEIVMRVMRDVQGRPVGILGVSRDITPRRQAEEALRRLQAEQQAVLDALPACVYHKDCENRVLWANQAMADLVGVPRDQMIGRSGTELFPPEVARHFWEDDLEVIRTDRPKADILEMVRNPDGSARWYATRKIPWHDAEGKVVGVLGCSLDVTPLREAEEALRRSEERFRTVFAAAPVGIVIVDEQCRALDANPAYERILGYTLAELKALPNLLVLASPSEYEADAAQFREVVNEAHRAAPSELHLVRKDSQEITVRHVGTVVCDAEGRFVYGLAMIEDVTETRRMEERLRQGQKLEAIGRLAGGIAHDFNNLLQIILGCTGEALTGLTRTSPLHLPLSQSEEAARRAASLTRQLLAFSRQQVLQPERLDLQAVVRNLLSLLTRLIGETVHVDFQPGPDVGPVLADRGQVEQILMNLCVNARDAMPAGGRLTIATESALFDEEFCLSHDWARPGRYAVLRVADTGMGMDAATMARVFEPFFTTKEVGKGSGLGLPVAYGIARQHGGTVTVETTRGQGSTFRVFLPCTEGGPPPARAAVPRRHASAQGTGETVLVAEDEELVRDICRRMLERAGYRVLTASDGAEAVRIVEENPGDIDLLIFDVVMPGMGGREAYETIRSDYGELPCIFVSGYASPEADTAVQKPTGMRLLHKPYESDILLRVVRDVLDSRATGAPPAR